MRNKIQKTKCNRTCKSLERVYTLAHDGQVAHAIVMWNKHKIRHEGCICDHQMFDQKLCGFCLLSGLQTESLAQACPSQADLFHTSAQTVSSFLMQRNPIVRRWAAA